MIRPESIALSLLVNALWQIPLLFEAGWLVARAMRRLGPLAEHRVWVTVLLFQSLLPAASAIPWEALRALLDLSRRSLDPGQAHVSVVMGPGTAFGNPHLPAWLLTAAALSYVVVTAWFAARFAWGLFNLRLLRRNSLQLPLTGDDALHWSRCATDFGVRDASLASSPQIYGPITIGIVRRLVLLPSKMVSSSPGPELRTAISHEFAHMRRRDFLKNLLYELVSLPVRFHPVLALTRARLMETREMVCDQIAAGLDGHHQYARSLLRLAALLVDGPSVRTPHAIGIFDAVSFERRVMQLTRKPNPPSTLRRSAVLAASAVFAAGICATTLALSVHVDALAAARGLDDEHAPAKPTGPVAVKAEIMQKQIVNKVPPAYPQEAKVKRVQGTVKLDAIVNKKGEVEQLKVLSGPKELQQSSLDAVRQWTYKPFLLNGDPVDVRTSISVVYTLKK